MISKLWDSIKNFLAPKNVPGMWDKEVEPKKVITKGDIAEAVDEMNRPKPKKPYGLMFLQGFTILWMVAHFVLLYIGMGTPLSIGILLYVMVSFFMSSHYLILLRGSKNDV